MFEINDDFLTNVGYDVATLSEEQKAQYISEFTDEFTERLQERFLAELDEEQVEDLDRIQSSVDSARSWLDEFHTDYRERKDFQQISQVMNDEDDSALFYAELLWMQYAIPAYGGVIQEELNAYQADLINKRRQADELVARLG